VIVILRKIIKINGALCDGCGNCMIACAEGAIQVVNGKAQVVSDKFCDGLGACIGECPTGALTIEEREAEEYNEGAAKTHLHQSNCNKSQVNVERLDKEGYEGHRLQPLALCSVSQNRSKDAGPKRHLHDLSPLSQLSSWPIQMRLAHVDAPYFKDARLLIAADCSGFACPSIADFTKGKVVLIGCPKLDEIEPFIEKLTEILSPNEIKEITVLHMEVPCCSNLVRLVFRAVEKSQKDITLDNFICMIDGSIAKDEGV
jgi:ferredoxin